ncbi:acyl-CoA dehydrogenase family protein [Streptomyces benahoarensis]|uniref:Acyl-CoA dehydrogenase n=1 Tax=Streptomyces benahoarensis TaxID=2595054 RepID=A0A553ZGV7_9ACTN|nr:acyl-CoA dehydrogenase family protein [Streptomyces benahoarensis]TSB22980.1 acyl-CoA dehydrogenase [Streptomyces benahoarensis]TSB40705.1 acyl-CoA dehydrogenase [Streptomyces benahoarensis]
MDFQLTEEQGELCEGMRTLLAGRFGPERLRAAVAAPALDRALWRELGAAGLFALRLPEADGGVGLGLPEAVLLFEETGRALLPGPLIACHLLAGRLDGVATGERIVGLTEVPGGPGVWEHPDECAELVVLPGGDGGPVRVLRPDAAADVPRPSSVDPLTPLAPVPAGAGEALPGPAPEVRRMRREAALLTAAQQLGSAVRTVEKAVAYARVREQFGAPIGAFQAVKHLCAGMLVRAETARAAVYAAAVTESEDEAYAAKLLADDAAVRNARDCLQVHGGMGFTWEAEIHLHLKRAWWRAECWGSARETEERLAVGLLTG